jgi:hypothetical protein
MICKQRQLKGLIDAHWKLMLRSSSACAFSSQVLEEWSRRLSNDSKSTVKGG